MKNAIINTLIKFVSFIFFLFGGVLGLLIVSGFMSVLIEIVSSALNNQVSPLLYYGTVGAQSPNLEIYGILLNLFKSLVDNLPFSSFFQLIIDFILNQRYATYFNVSIVFSDIFNDLAVLVLSSTIYHIILSPFIRFVGNNECKSYLLILMQTVTFGFAIIGVMTLKHLIPDKLAEFALIIICIIIEVIVSQMRSYGDYRCINGLIGTAMYYFKQFINDFFICSFIILSIELIKRSLDFIYYGVPLEIVSSIFIFICLLAVPFVIMLVDKINYQL